MIFGDVFCCWYQWYYHHTSRRRVVFCMQDSLFNFCQANMKYQYLKGLQWPCDPCLSPGGYKAIGKLGREKYRGTFVILFLCCIIFLWSYFSGQKMIRSRKKGNSRLFDFSPSLGKRDERDHDLSLSNLHQTWLRNCQNFKGRVQEEKIPHTGDKASLDRCG